MRRKKAAAVKAPKDSHKHKCPNCGFVWSHEDSCSGDTKAHTCRKCGTEQWFKFWGDAKAAFQSCLIAVRKAVKSTIKQLDLDL